MVDLRLLVSALNGTLTAVLDRRLDKHVNYPSNLMMSSRSEMSRRKNSHSPASLFSQFFIARGFVSSNNAAYRVNDCFLTAQRVRGGLGRSASARLSVGSFGVKNDAGSTRLALPRTNSYPRTAGFSFRVG